MWGIMKTFVYLIFVALFLACEQHFNLDNRTFSISSGADSDDEVYAVAGSTNVSIPGRANGLKLSYSVSPSLPTGLTIDESTGEISGVPSSTFSSQTFTVSASNNGGVVSYDVTIISMDGYEVTSSGDGSDANTADSVCETSTPGECTFRAAVEQALADGGNQLVLLDSEAYTLTSDLSFAIASSDILIMGQGDDETSITSANDPSIQMAFSEGTTTFQNLTIEDFGVSAGSGPSVVLDIHTNANVKFEEVVIQNNYSSSGGVIEVDNSSTTELNGVYIYNNNSTGRGIIYNPGTTLTIENTTWYQNDGENGGCIETQYGSNTTIRNSTCFGNNTRATAKSAINMGTCGCATQGTLENILIADNTHSLSDQAAGLRLGSTSGGSYNVSFVNIIVTNNLDADLDEENCFVHTSGGTPNDLGSNIFSGSDCANARFTNSTFGVDPLLIDSAPSDNGGSVPTINISTSSPAIDAGDNTYCTTVDQRGYSRPVDFNGGGANCDIGPLELQI